MNLEQYRKACMDYVHKQGLMVTADDCAALQEIYEESVSQKITNSMSTDHVRLIAQAYFEGRKKGSELQKKMTQGVITGMRSAHEKTLASITS